MSAPTLKKFGEHAILLEWPSEISEEIQQQVVATSEFLLKHFPEMIRETVPAYCSLAVFLKTSAPADTFLKILQPSLRPKFPAEGSAFYRYTLPVCYDEPHAPDLCEMASLKQLSEAALIEKHTNRTYRVAFLGFLPGFPYLMNLDPTLHTPRKQSPRAHVPKGSVGIAGGQTGIYPSDSPGGWNIIGRTPVALFSVVNHPPALVRPGDEIVFEKISETEYRTIRKAVENSTYLMKKESCDG